MPSKHISSGANTSNPLFNSPHALKTHFTRCQHLKPRLQVPPCPQNTVHPVPTPSSLPPCPVSNVLCIAAVPHSLVLLLCICVLGCSPFVLQVVPPSAMHRVRIWDAKPIEKNKQQRLQYNSHGLQFLGQQCTNCNIPQLGRLPKLGAAGGQAPHSHATWQLGSPPPCVHGTGLMAYVMNAVFSHHQRETTRAQYYFFPHTPWVKHHDPSLHIPTKCPVMLLSLTEPTNTVPTPVILQRMLS